jgi:histone-lysine N-methyltransferase SETMAR
MLGKGMRVLHDSTPAHARMTLAASLGYEILPHPPYSPDLALSNFFVFPQLKKPLRGKRFKDNDDVISAVEDFLSSQNETFYNQSTQKLMHRGKCVALQGAYVEKG